MSEFDDSLLANIDASLVAMALRFLSEHKPTPLAEKRRWQDRVILEHIPQKSSVLDLGCGDGQLLSTLIKTLNIKGQGVELDPTAVMCSIDKGVPVLNVNLDEGLSDFADQSFDYVILESTLQTLRNPMVILKEMLRVGRRGIVSFPNFGHFKVRLDLATRGRMPITADLPYGWHDTPNIHLFTLADFFDWCEANQVKVNLAFGLNRGQISPIGPDDNLTVEEAILFLEK